MQSATTPARSAPSPAFLSAAQHLATVLGLDIDRVVRGDSMAYKGVVFSLQHHAAEDPDALVLVTRMGPLDADTHKALLRHHFAVPVGVAGYYAMLPGTDDVVHCLRFDLARQPNPVDSVLMRIELAAACREQLAGAIDARLKRTSFNSQAGAVNASRA